MSATAPERKTIRHGAVTTEYCEIGAGTAVVLLAGRGGSAVEQYAIIGPGLAQAGYRAVPVNWRGVGGSRGALTGLSLHDLAADCVAVIRRLSPPVHIVGRAFGSRVARCIAARYPDLVRSLTLLAAGGLVPTPRPASAARAPVPLRVWPAVARAHARADRATPLEDWWAGGDATMLVIQGLDDVVAVPENGRRLARDYPGRVHLHEIAGVGHRFPAECPDRVITIVAAFLRDVDGAAPA